MASTGSHFEWNEIGPRCAGEPAHLGPINYPIARLDRKPIDCITQSLDSRSNQDFAISNKSFDSLSIIRWSEIGPRCAGEPTHLGPINYPIARLDRKSIDCITQSLDSRSNQDFAISNKPLDSLSIIRCSEIGPRCAGEPTHLGPINYPIARLDCKSIDCITQSLNSQSNQDFAISNKPLDSLSIIRWNEIGPRCAGEPTHLGPINYPIARLDRKSIDCITQSLNSRSNQDFAISNKSFDSLSIIRWNEIGPRCAGEPAQLGPIHYPSI